MSWKQLGAEPVAPPPAADVALGWPDSARAPYLGNVATLAHYRLVLRESEAENEKGRLQAPLSKNTNS